ncbi:hypothetical protein PIB30_060885 [Stylosanthes scabra]|uniref:Uncharacterized protein n=1 Tax=Stylosanthes scabra TaxID=79078 RepID=A0ABU6SM15_9FABA|nr:hypothetical protein [Stylosanthes scabra]
MGDLIARFRELGTHRPALLHVMLLDAYAFQRQLAHVSVAAFILLGFVLHKVYRRQRSQRVLPKLIYDVGPSHRYEKQLTSHSLVAVRLWNFILSLRILTGIHLAQNDKD